MEDSPMTSGCDADIFLYNDHNEKGGRDGICVLALSLVDGKGNFVKQCSHPKPRFYFSALQSKYCLTRNDHSQIILPPILKLN